LSIRVVSTPVAGSSLTQLALSGADSPWFVTAPSTAEGWKRRAEEARSSLVAPEWLGNLSPAILSRGLAAERLSRAAASGFVVTSGQQPGLFGGPLYTWWKALSVLAFADELENVTGMPVAPVFWAATDDSDFRESATTVVATAEGAEIIEMPEPPGVGVALAQVGLGDLSKLIERLEAAAGSATATSVFEAVRAAYAPEKTIGQAYVELLGSIVGPLGISIIDAAHPAVRTTAHPVLLKALEASSSIHDALDRRSEQLGEAGHSVQVKIVEGRTLAFSETQGKRARIRIRDAASIARDAAPGTLGPNVLLRPIVERSILPTVAYLGGPAEIAYFAQVTAVAEALETAAPVVLPRWSGYVVEPRIERILDRYGLTAADFRDPHAVESRLARASLPESLSDNIESMRSSIRDAVDRMREGDGAELIPDGVLDGLSRNISHRIERLERRVAASVKRRGNDALKDAAIARGALYPFGRPQERSLNIIPLLARYGPTLLDDVLSEVRAHAARLA
jgi:bacillithiol biosynthesis cysteine-adding enzyme BshC